MIFIDTTTWVGAGDPSDSAHETSKPIIEALLRGKLPHAITTDYVLDELITLFGKRMENSASHIRKHVEKLMQSTHVEVLFVDQSLFKAALPIFETHKGKLSFTDAITVAVMRDYNMETIYSHDKEFDHVEGVVRKESVE